MSDKAMEGFEAEFLGNKIIEMAERVAVAHKCAPGAMATYVFEVDDVHFKVAVTIREVAA
jgi:hypothetical protein